MPHGGYRSAAIVVTIGCIATLSACGDSPSSTSSSPSSRSCPTDGAGLPSCRLTYLQVAALPEGKLYYPGATILRHIGADEETGGLEGEPVSAFAGAISGTPDSSSVVYAWYRTSLESHGWTSTRIGATQAWLSAQGYTRGRREHFVVAMDNPKVLESLIGQSLPSSGTVFEFTYTIASAKS